jgi:hypothetical protein
MVAVGEKLGAEVERENKGDVFEPACRGGVRKGARKRVSLPDLDSAKNCRLSSKFAVAKL